MKIYNKNIYWQKLIDNENSNTRSHSSVEGIIDTYHYIFNCANNTIDYVSDTFEFVTGRKKSRFSISTFLDMIHPDDIEHYFLCEERSQQFSNSLSFGEHFRYRMDYAYRIQKQDGSYMTIRQQRQAIDINAQGHLTKHVSCIKKFRKCRDCPSTTIMFLIR
ncbi:PAS domain-containing protein [Sphingobacterium oryzagri]|uniref:PAS domain-containing protein n=1 Tax=Sphingobacterium oryzagri TaxID=3025669 RepID=UPI003D17586D